MKYIGIKFVDAVPMTAEVANEEGYRVNTNTGEGYEVTYEDGYKSWCPKDVFEKHNFVVKNEVLAKTCEGMVSPDYKERFRAELIQLQNRYDGLGRMLHAWSKGTLTSLQPAPRELYDKQLEGMELYFKVLVKRAMLEGVTIPGVTE